MVRKFGREGDVTPVPEANKTKGLRDRLGRTLRACSRWEETEGDDNHAGFPDQWHFSMLKSKQRERKGGGEKKLFASLPNACVASQEFTSRWCHVHKQIMRTSYMLNKLVMACESERTDGAAAQTGCLHNDGILTHFLGSERNPSGFVPTKWPTNVKPMFLNHLLFW